MVGIGRECRLKSRFCRIYDFCSLFNNREDIYSEFGPLSRSTYHDWNSRNFVPELFEKLYER